MTDPDKPADDLTQTDELAARFMAARMASGQNWIPQMMVSKAYEAAEAFMAERRRRKGAGE